VTSLMSGGLCAALKESGAPSADCDTNYDIFQCRQNIDRKLNAEEDQKGGRMTCQVDRNHLEHKKETVAMVTGCKVTLGLTSKDTRNVSLAAAKPNTGLLFSSTRLCCSFVDAFRDYQVDHRFPNRTPRWRLIFHFFFFFKKKSKCRMAYH
jgi:hypothetical protein